MPTKRARSVWTASCSAAALACLSIPAIADGAPRTDKDAARLVPLTTRVPLNGVQLEFGLEGVAGLGALGGPDRDTVPTLDTTFTLDEQIDEAVRGTLFTRRQTGLYFQLRTVDNTRTVTTTKREAVDLSGSRLFLSITGKCLFRNEDPDAYCSYTPGADVGEADVNPDTLLPENFEFDSTFGRVIQRETHEALTAPGFQRGSAATGEYPGLVVDLPNNGYSFSELRGDRNGISRYENVETRPIATMSHVEQRLYSNSDEATLDRTIRGAVVLKADEWTTEALVAQGLAWVLPSFDARLPETGEAPNLGISNNLFYAANNTRMPEDSFTAYQSGVAWVSHPETPPTSAAETPVAWANTIWLGFSPVRDIAQSTSYRFDRTGTRDIVESEFTQGGTTGQAGEIIEGQLTIVDNLTDQLSEIDLTSIDDLFVQSGADVTSEDAIREVTSQEVSDYRYVPHLSFSGNRTSGNSVLRYYTGLIVGDDINAYAGGDVQVNTETGWEAFAGGTFYSDPDRDYFSELSASLSRRVALGAESSLRFGVSGSVELDRPEVDGTVLEPGEGANLVDVVAGYRRRNLGYTLRQRFSDVGTDENATSTTLGVNYRVDQRLSLTMEVTPASTEDAYISARAGLAWKLRDAADAPTLRVQWAKIDYDYGNDAIGQPLETSEQTLLASLQMRF